MNVSISRPIFAVLLALSLLRTTSLASQSFAATPSSRPTQDGKKSKPTRKKISEAELEKIRQEMDETFRRSYIFSFVFSLISKPQTNLDEWLNSLSDIADIKDCLLRKPKASALAPALQQAPAPMQNLATSLSRLYGVTGHLVRQQHQRQTVYILTLKLDNSIETLSVVYDENGSLICTSEDINEGGSTREKCAPQLLAKRPGQLLWKATRKN